MSRASATTKESSQKKRGGALERAAGPAKSARPALGPGLHGGYVELVSDRSYRVRTLMGERLVAVLGDGVDPALVDECLRASQMVILVDSERGPTIMGALQTSRSIAVEADGTAVLRAKGVRIQAERELVVEAGTTSLRLDPSGAVRAQGDRMVIDMGSNVRVLSALVELP